MSAKAICTTCHQPFHGLTKCDEAASPRIKNLLIRAHSLREALQAVEQQLFDLDYEHYCYITGVFKRTK